MLKIAFLHDADFAFKDDTELYNRTIINAASQNGVLVTYDNLKDFKQTKQSIQACDLVIINSAVNCSFEFLLLEFLFGCDKPYIKYEHDYNFCTLRTAACFTDPGVTGCCNGERFRIYRKLFENAGLSVFTSEEHFRVHHEIYGEAIERHFILPAVMDAGFFWQQVKSVVKQKEEKHRWKNVLIYKSFGGLGDFLFAIPAINKIAQVSDKVSVCVPFILADLIKKQLPEYQIFAEDYIRIADFNAYDKIIDLKNYPSFQKDAANPHQMDFPSYRRLKQHAVKHYIDGVATLHHEIDNSFEGYPYFKSSIPKGNYFTVHPGAGFEAKYWPAEKYGQLIQLLLNMFNDLECKVILGPTDPKPEQLFKKVPDPVSFPKGKLEAIADHISGALFHVGNDSGITHLAGAFNVPTVCIHGPTGPGTWMSFAEHKELIWGKRGVCDIACNYDVAVNCSHRICLNSVTPARVCKHVLKLLQKILPAGQSVRYLLNPEVEIKRYQNEFVAKMGNKEILLDFSEETELALFENLVKSTPLTSYSDSFIKLAGVLHQNGMLFKINAFPEVNGKDKVEKEQVDITIVSHVFKHDGIGRNGIAIGEILDGPFVINGISTRRSTARDMEPALYQKMTNGGPLGTIALFTDVLWQSNKFKPYKAVPKQAQIKLCYSMFESSLLPEEWVTIINSTFDGVIVPDPWLVNVYKNSGVQLPVQVLPLGCYLKDFLQHPLKQKPNEVFTFGVSAGVWMRKNITGVIEAFKLAFKSNEKVKLRVHSRFGFGLEMEQILKTIGNDPMIEFFVETLADKEYFDFMASLDAYVQLSMGEGFSITPREAMALGLPVILSDNTAHTTICQSGLVYAVPTTREIPAYYEVFSRDIGSFYSCDINIAAQHMHNIFDHKESVYSDAAKRREWASQYDLTNMKKLYVETFGKILKEGF